MQRLFRKFTRSNRVVSEQTVDRAVSRVLESLENRTLMSVSLDANGYTKIASSSDSRTVYVSSSQGNDGNDGLSSNTPVKSLSRAESLLRSGMPDQMLLKKGDVWRGETIWWSKSGRNANEPMVVGSYGTGARPTLKTADKMGFYTGSPVHDVAVMGLHFEANTRNPNSPDFNGTGAGNYGIQLAGTGTNILLEDNEVEYYQDNVVITGWQGQLTNIKVRKNVIHNSWSTPALSAGGKSQGLYVSDTNGITIEGNIFDHNGWNEQIPNAGATVFGHNVYMWASDYNVVFRDNISANAASHGLQARSGGIIENNLFINNPIGLVFGKGSAVLPGGASGRVSGNVFIGGRDIAGSKRGWAIEVGNTKPGGGTLIASNIITNDLQNASPAIRLSAIGTVDNPQDIVGLNDVTIENNIVNKWFSALDTSNSFAPGAPGATAYNNVTVRNNELSTNGAGPRVVDHLNGYASWNEHWSGNMYSSPQAQGNWFTVGGSPTSFTSWKNTVEPTALAQQQTYSDPNRTIESYNSSVGGAWSVGDFMARADSTSGDNYNVKYTSAPVLNYIRAGFDRAGSLTPSGNNPAPAPTPTPSTGSVPSATLVSTPQITSDNPWAATIKVKYVDDSAIDNSTLGADDVVITGPNGFKVNGWFYQADASGNGASRTAAYSINAPGGVWDASDNGTYTVSVLGGGVKDVNGNAVPAGAIGTFQVNVGGAMTSAGATTAALVSAPNVTAPSPWALSIKVKFDADSAVRFATLGADDIRISGPNGENVNGWFYQADASGDAQSRTASYSLNAPGGSWDRTDNGFYTITMLPSSVTDTSGNAVAPGTLGSFTVAIP